MKGLRSIFLVILITSVSTILMFNVLPSMVRPSSPPTSPPPPSPIVVPLLELPDCPINEHKVIPSDIYAVLQEHIGDYIPTFTTETLPSHRLFDPNCPQYITGKVHSRAGIGHKTFNFLAIIIASQHLGLRYLHQNFILSSDHSNLITELDKWLGYDQNEYNIVNEPYNKYKVVRLPDWWSGFNMETTFKEIADFVEANRTLCNIIYDLKDDFFPYPSRYAKWIMGDKYRKARQKNPMELALYKKNTLNIALHFRNGDLAPTSDSWLKLATELVTNVLLKEQYPNEWGIPTISSEDLAKIPIQINLFVFNEVEWQPINGITINIHQNTPLDWTLHHIINADIVIRTSSSFTDISTIINTNALVVNPPNREKYLLWDGCAIGGICLGTEEYLRKFGLDPLQKQAILQLRHRWLTKYSLVESLGIKQ